MKLACVAKPIPKNEIKGNTRAEKAMNAEWDRLIDKKVWDYSKVRDWGEVASTARQNGTIVNLGRIFGIMVLKGSELPEDHPLQKYKYRVVFQGNNVVDQDWAAAIFQDLGSSPASMEAAKMTDAYSCLPGHALEQADAEQAYVQAKLEGHETWICLPGECIDRHRNDPKLRHLLLRGWHAPSQSPMRTP